MKMDKDFRKVTEISGSEQGKGRSVLPEKKEKNLKRSIYNEIEEDKELDFKKNSKKEDSILSYFESEDEDDEWDDEDDEWDDEDDEWDDEDEDWDDEDEDWDDEDEDWDDEEDEN